MKLREVTARFGWHNASPYVRTLVVAAVATDAFIDGQPEVGMVAYDMATLEVGLIKNPLQFLEAFIAVEQVNRQFVQYLGE